MKRIGCYLLQVAPGGFMGVLLGHFGLRVGDWQFWGWLISFAVLLLARDIVRGGK